MKDEWKWKKINRKNSKNWNDFNFEKIDDIYIHRSQMIHQIFFIWEKNPSDIQKHENQQRFEKQKFLIQLRKFQSSDRVKKSDSDINFIRFESWNQFHER